MPTKYPPLTEERRMLLHQKQREKSISWLADIIAGRDLVAITLSDDPSEIMKREGLRRTVLGRTAYSFDEEVLIKRISNGAYGTCCSLMAAAAMPDDHRMAPLLDVFKLIICDARCLEEGATLQDAYEAQLREEELQTPAERAREVVRNEDEKTARRNARLIIPHLERISPDEITQMEMEGGKGSVVKAIWNRIAPPPPAWVQQIVDAQKPWGFVFYRNREAEREFGHDWDEVWDEIQCCTRRIPISINGERPHEYSLLDHIHSGGNEYNMRRLWTNHWATGSITQDSSTSEDDALRRHFKDYRRSLSSPGILRNTFIVIDDECIPEDIRRYSRQDIYDFWVWAYDADWEPSADVTLSNGDEYRGRVKVPLYSLDAWFYGARSEGVVSLKDMWLKAQTHPEKLWICRSKPMESWHHEPYI